MDDQNKKLFSRCMTTKQVTWHYVSV